MVFLYILDDQLRREEIVESYESFIWTERYNDSGDFELVIEPRVAESNLTLPGTLLTIDNSDRVMQIDTIVANIDEDGKRFLKISGRSIESWLVHRANQSAFYPGGAMAEVSIDDLPGDIMRDLVDDICRTNADITQDNIPFLQAGTYSSFTGSIPEPASTINFRHPVATLYDTIKAVANPFDLGFRLIRPNDDSELYWEVYTGFDRTTGQIDRDPVIFSPEVFDNVSSSSEINSNALEKTVAYVFHPVTTRVVYADGYDSTNAGSSRKVLLVDASDIDLPAGTALDNALDFRGRQELARNRYVMGFDGAITPRSNYIYNTHYQLGDLVELQSNRGYKRILRVTEQIFTSDAEGEKSYPTLTFNTLITPGTWHSLPGSQEWYDYISTVYWSDM
jgi:hypothetical protein